MNLDDKALFLDAMEDVQPLKRHTDVHWQPTRNLKTPQRIDTLQLDNFLTTGFLDILPLNEPLEVAYGTDYGDECQHVLIEMVPSDIVNCIHHAARPVKK